MAGLAGYYRKPVIGCRHRISLIRLRRSYRRASVGLSWLSGSTPAAVFFRVSDPAFTAFNKAGARAG